MNEAAFLAPIFSTLGQRGYPATVFVVVRIGIAAISVAAGIALWRRQPEAATLASAALILSTLAAVVTYTTHLLPTNVMPGDAPFYIAAIVCFNGAWLVYLARYYGVRPKREPTGRT